MNQTPEDTNTIINPYEFYAFCQLEEMAVPKGVADIDTSGWYAENSTITIDRKQYTFDSKGCKVQ